jgi:molybdenum cofactor synthesis domain-containing protein
MSGKIEVVSVNISTKKGTAKNPVQSITIDENGIRDDAHSGPWHRQVSLLAQEDIDAFSAKSKKEFVPGDFAENLTLRGVDLGRVAILDRFRIGQVELEVTQIGKACHGDNCAIYREVGQCIMPRQGLFCRALSAGEIRPGDRVSYHPRQLRILIITLSDRAHQGEYTDRSGPRLKELIAEHFGPRRWHPEISTLLLPDDASRLHKAIQAACSDEVDILFTTGGTGVGPRDQTPEVILDLCDKTIPGIMEAIRIKFGANNPRALLSRSVAAVTGRTLMFALPGSVKAVEEYLGEITLTLEHLFCMLHGLDVH